MVNKMTLPFFATLLRPFQRRGLITGHRLHAQFGNVLFLDTTGALPMFCLVR